MRWLFAKPNDEERSAAVVEVSLAQRASLLRDEQEVVWDIARAFKVAEAGIRRELADSLGRWEAALARGGRVGLHHEWEQSRLTSLLRRMHELVQDFSGQAETITRTAQAERVVQAGRNTAKQLKAARVTTSFDMLHEEALRDIAGFLADGRPLKALFDTIAPHAVAEARDAFVKGIAIGRNPRDIARELFKGVKGQAAKVDEWTRDRAVLIARTETMRAYREATTRNYAANPEVVLGWAWLSARDSRTCPACWARDGSIHKAYETMATHPGCRCVQVPQLDPRINVGIGTGEEALSKLPERDQRSILGPTRFELWQRGDVKFGDFAAATHSEVWGEGVRVRSLRELRKR